MRPTYEQLTEQLRRINEAAANLGGLIELAAEIRRSMDLVHEAEAPGSGASAMPTVVLEVNGGLIHLARSTLPMRIVVLDEDTEGGDKSQVQAVDGEDKYVTDLVLEPGGDPGCGGVAPDVVAAMLAQIDGADRESDEIDKENDRWRARVERDAR